MRTSRFKFKHFRDLTAEDINCDLHLHTAHTDGQADIEAILREATARNLSCIAFTEHVRRDADWFESFAGAVRRHAGNYPRLQALVGCEAKAMDRHGSLDAGEPILSQCDIVLGSVHRFPDGRGGLFDFDAVPRDDFAHIEYELAAGLLMRAPIDVLAHPGGMHMRRFGADLPADLMRHIMLKSLEREIAIEINSFYLKDFNCFLALAAEVNPLVSIGSDMHRLEQLGGCRDRLMAHEVSKR